MAQQPPLERRMTDTALARSSDDFWPRDPASHTTHVAINAGNSVFMAALVQPDWDMFQSQHPAALLHASARVVRCSPTAQLCLLHSSTCSSWDLQSTMLRVVCAESRWHAVTEQHVSPLFPLFTVSSMLDMSPSIDMLLAGEWGPGVCERPAGAAQHGAAEAHGAAGRQRAAVRAAGAPHPGLPLLRLHARPRNPPQGAHATAALTSALADGLGAWFRVGSLHQLCSFIMLIIFLILIVSDMTNPHLHVGTDRMCSAPG